MSLDDPTWIEKRPMWQKVGGIILLVILSYVFVFWLGTVKAREWADSKYLQESAEREKKIAAAEASAAQHEQNEAKLARENELLKKQNEAMAEGLKQADTERERQALIAQAARDAEHAAKLSEIDTDENLNSQLCATCREYSARGLKLSFCSKCGGGQ